MSRFKFTISYLGGGFQGSQKQPNQHTVFGRIESLFFELFKQHIRCIPAGRTDTAVHAHHMVFHADFSFDFSIDRIQVAFLKHLVKDGIILRSIDPVSTTFHALSSATERSYDYLFTFDHALPHYLLNSVTLLFDAPRFIPSNNDLKRVFCGTKDWQILCNTSDVPSTVRTVIDVVLNIETYTPLFGTDITIYRLSVRANGFLYRMVRHITGILLHSMVNFTNMDNLIDYICVCRPMNYSLAPAQGLHLSVVSY